MKGIDIMLKLRRDGKSCGLRKIVVASVIATTTLLVCSTNALQSTGYAEDFSELTQGVCTYDIATGKETYEEISFDKASSQSRSSLYDVSDEKRTAMAVAEYVVDDGEKINEYVPDDDFDLDEETN